MHFTTGSDLSLWVTSLQGNTFFICHATKLQNSTRRYFSSSSFRYKYKKNGAHAKRMKKAGKERANCNENRSLLIYL